MAETNPANFANRPTEEVQAIASKGGQAAAQKAAEAKEIAKEETATTAGRNPDGTFVKGSEAAKEAGHVGGLHAAGKPTEEEVKENEHPTTMTSASKQAQDRKADVPKRALQQFIFRVRTLLVNFPLVCSEIHS